MSCEIEPFLSCEDARLIAAQFGTPVFVYDEKRLREKAREALAFPAVFGLTVRFAMKACGNRNILRIFHDTGIEFDASSGFEADRALLAGIPAEKIMLTAQELPEHLEELLNSGIQFNASSLYQLEVFGMLFPGRETGIRINPGIGSGSTNRTNVGGPSASFGIWHEDIDKIKHICAKYKLKIIRIHTHIGSGSDPEVWQRAAGMSLQCVELFPDAYVLNLGGGYKVGRVPGEKSTELHTIGLPILNLIKDFHRITGREIKLEIEPGTFLTANAGAVLARVQDTAYTGSGGYHFIKLDCGMTDILRPSLYGAQHPITLVPAMDRARGEEMQYLAAGHCCESGDILTPAPGDSEGLKTRMLQKAARGDLVIIGGAGAYVSSMCAKNYNSFPESAEVLKRADGTFCRIRKKQTLEQIIQNEEDAGF